MKQMNGWKSSQCPKKTTSKDCSRLLKKLQQSAASWKKYKKMSDDLRLLHRTIHQMLKALEKLGCVVSKQKVF